MLAVVPSWDGHSQPLLAFYHTGVVAHLEEQLRKGERSPTRALERIPQQHFGHFGEEACRRVDPDGLSFLNVNTPRDLTLLEVLTCQRRAE